MSDKLVPGSLWWDKTLTGSWTHPTLAPMRRVIEVVNPGSPHMYNDWVHGVSFWQERQPDGTWIDTNARRRASVLRRRFLGNFEHVRGPLTSP